jgi:hypothetical protein
VASVQAGHLDKMMQDGPRHSEHQGQILEPTMLLRPDIPKSMIYDITIESSTKLLFTMGLNIAASLLITHLHD